VNSSSVKPDNQTNQLTPCVTIYQTHEKFHYFFIYTAQISSSKRIWRDKIGHLSSQYKKLNNKIDCAVIDPKIINNCSYSFRMKSLTDKVPEAFVK